MIFLKFIRKISFYFDRASFEIRRIKRKYALIFMSIFLLLGIFSWLMGGKTDRVVFLYRFPRIAIGVGFMFFIWGISFAFCGLIFSGIILNCEKYIKHISRKICLYLALMQLFTLIIYPLFFGAVAPFLSFLSLSFAILFCFLAILSSFRYYSIWTICLILHIIWLFYNAYVCLAFILIN